MSLPTLYCVVDVETTLKFRTCFDIAWRIIDKKGVLFFEASYLVLEAFNSDMPYFQSKMRDYLIDVHTGRSVPLGLMEIRNRFNNSLRELKNKGFKIILCAYNAAFDFAQLPRSIKTLFDADMRWLVSPDLSDGIMDIWDNWCMTAPRSYNYATPKGNPATSAEIVYRFEFNKPDFVEEHRGIYDCIIECEILVKVLRRKQARKVVANPKDLTNMPWKRLSNYPAYTTSKDKAIVLPPKQ